MSKRDNDTQVAGKQQQLITLTAAFCKEHLDQEYAELAAKLIDRLSQQQPVLFASGRIQIWAAAVIHALCQINGGFEAGQPTHSKPDIIASYFGAAKGTITVKAKEIRDTLNLSRWGDEEFATSYMREHNPIKQMQALLGALGLGAGFAREASEDDDALTISYSLSDEEMMQVLGISTDQMQIMMRYSPESDGYTLELTEEQVDKLEEYLSQREGFTVVGDADEYDDDDVEYHTVAELRTALGLSDEQIAALTTYDQQSGEYYLDLSEEQEEQIAAYHQRLIDHDRLN